MKSIDKIKKSLPNAPLIAGICIMGLVLASGNIFADMSLFTSADHSKEASQNISTDATYKGELSLDNKEYTFGVDALTGEILTIETGNMSASVPLSKAPDAVSSATTKVGDATKVLPANPASPTTPRGVAIATDKTVDAVSSATTKVGDATKVLPANPASPTTPRGVVITTDKTVDAVSSATQKPNDSTVAVPVDLSIYIGEAAVRAIVLAEVPGATITELHLEFDDSTAEYEVEMYLDNTEYEFEIDAITGKILEQESENESIDDDDEDENVDDDDVDDDSDDEEDEDEEDED